MNDKTDTEAIRRQLDREVALRAGFTLEEFERGDAVVWLPASARELAEMFPPPPLPLTMPT